MKRIFWGTYLFLIFSLLFIQFVINPILAEATKIYFHDSINEYSRQLARGSFHMMEIDLLRLSPDQWQNRIAQLETQFGYKIALLNLTELSLTEEQMAELQERKIVVADEGEQLYHLVGESQIVLRKGPFAVLEPKLGYFNILIWLTVIASIGALTFLAIIPYWRQLRKMRAAAIAFGNGQLHTRVEISKISNLAPLAESFNTMAEQIGHLINSHKDLTNAVSHELRTPLSRLRFGLEMLETAEDPEKRSLYAHEMQTDVSELEELVSELLTFARFDRQKPDLQLAFHPLESFLHQVIAESIPDDIPVRCHLTLHLDTASSHVRFEPKYLARALGNLLQNAVHHAEKDIQVLVERIGGDCCIHVDDDGPGIPESERNRVFEPFVRLDTSRTRSSGGYGLGLAIVRKILQWHNGLAIAASSPLGGARFTCRWPGFSH